MSTNYSQYLGAKKCCDLKVQGPQGPQGVPGPASVGPMGYQGATGAQGYQGATGRGCIGPTGAQGPAGTTGASQWTSMNGVGLTGAGYTGIGVTGQDVLIYGNLLVTGGIDPTYLALEPQPSAPSGFVNPLWVDNSGNLRSEQILLSDGTNTLTLNETSITHSNATLPLTITSTGVSKNINIDTPSIVSIGDVNSAGNDTSITVDDVNQIISLNALDGGVILDCGTNGSVNIGDLTGGLSLQINPQQVITSTTLGIQLTNSTIKYPNDVRSANYNFVDATNAIQTFTTASTVTLFIIDEERNGKQFIITNTSAGNLVVNTSNSQNIYTTGVAPATTRTLASGATRQFTSIKISNTPTFAWSMI